MVVKEIRRRWPEKAITLSLGERPDEDYQRWFDAGADRYLLRHETANAEHYGRLHPEGMSYENRVRCLQTLKRIGYETGTGMMVGSPYQTVDDLVGDLRFIEKLQPQMIGIGPFVSHRDTPFAECENGSVETTLRLIAILRLMHPEANIPATTSLGTLATDGREQGIMAGANVVMPNLSPVSQRKKYALYDNKICMDLEAAESRRGIEEQLRGMGYFLS
jgi:biotin synthase